jgi:hypothetical protein
MQVRRGFWWLLGLAALALAAFWESTGWTPRLRERNTRRRPGAGGDLAGQRVLLAGQFLQPPEAEPAGTAAGADPPPV